jgi:ribosomal protein S18 acetylase RimI-like enzyme
MQNKSDIAPAIHVRKATETDIPILAPALAESFVAQPLTKWILGEGEEGLRKGEEVLALDFRNALRYDLMFTTNELQGAALWHPPERRVSAWKNFIWFLKLLRIVGFNRNFFAQMAAFWRFERLFPREANYYLSMLAVAPAFQGMGIGSALLRPVLEMCDARGIPAYTVTDMESNVRFYERLGFRVRDTFPIPKAGVTAWTLWRKSGSSY